jgi:sulfite exporter TauE/SafE
MSLELLLTALAMGLAGGPHCVAMCGAACGAICSAAGARAPSDTADGDGAGASAKAGVLSVVAMPGAFKPAAVALGDVSAASAASGVRRAARAPVAAAAPRGLSALQGAPAGLHLQGITRVMLQFQAGRLVGYGALGALAAASVQGLGWLSTQVAAVRPVWTLMHAAALLLGLALLWLGRQPAWMQGAAQRVWRTARRLLPRERSAPAALGALWALMPCGLLYSALMVAALAGDPLQGALVMAAFAVSSGAVLAAGPWAWSWLRRQGAGPAGDGAWGVRLAGLSLAGLSAWALWMGMTGRIAAWCVS